MHATRRLWVWLGVVFLLSFAVLGWMGREIYLAAPPIPEKVISEKGDVLFSHQQVELGQQAWRAAGGQQLGSVWGHGSYVAPDWSADWLHREALALREALANERYGKPVRDLALDQKAAIDAAMKIEMRTNTYDAALGVIRVSTARARAIREVARHYEGLFGDDAALQTLREQYAMTAGALANAEDRAALAAFFFWSSWAAATDRPGETRLSYTSNWPHEPLVENTPTTGSGMSSGPF